ncbi:uncharacterized protein [Nicotiana sylvestris]|uniref:uncharacterized protein n=1 Tax=Nicotiana sylvestris TaxID=4096 RepID=UPI00388C7BE6
MAPKDEDLTVFHTPKGIYCYKVMPFGLKHAGATYQRVMQNNFDDLLHKNVKCNVDDLVGKLAYLRRFISNLAGRCQPFSCLMKKCVPCKWDQECSNAFESIKSYLMKPPVLEAPIFGKSLILYISAQERANPIKFVMSKHVLSDLLARWYLQFQQFEIVYIPQKAIKGQVLVDSLAGHPIPDDWELTDELPDEDAMVIEVKPPWKMYFDGVAHRGGAGTSVVFLTSQGVLPYSFTLTQLCSNNVAEYQALILGLEMAVEMKRLQLQVFGDSQLVVNQLLGSYEVKKPELHPYHDYAKKLMGWLGDVTIQHVPRKENKKVDILAALASSLILPDQA